MARRRGKGKGREPREAPRPPRGAVRTIYDPTKAARGDLATARACALWGSAVIFVRALLASDPGATERVRRQWREDPRGWWAPHHFQAGTALRNRLREAGYGEGELGVTNLDNVYVELIEEAAGIPGGGRK